jgi:hypothetical protein
MRKFTTNANEHQVSSLMAGLISMAVFQIGEQVEEVLGTATFTLIPLRIYLLGYLRNSAHCIEQQHSKQ